MVDAVRCALVALLLLALPHPLPAAPSPRDPGDASSLFAYIQFIANIPDAGPVDVYIDDHLFLDDFAYQTATPFLPVPHGRHKVDVVSGEAPDNSQVLWTGTHTVLREYHYVMAFQGILEAPKILLKSNVRLTPVVGDTEFFVIQGTPDAGDIDIRVLDPNNNNKITALLENNFPFGRSSIYRSLESRVYNFEVTNADNTERLGIYHFDLSKYHHETFVLFTSGSGRSATDGFTLLAVSTEGELYYPSISTAAATSDELPDAFLLEQNYPNPFNPETQISYTVPHEAPVHLAVYDLLGRPVRELVNARQPAGSHAITWDGTDDTGHPSPSGLYLYRLTSGAVVRTRTLTLVR